MICGAPTSYSDRSLEPLETWGRIKPLLPRLGVTRLSRLTGLDRIGIPVWNAVTPNAKSIVISQGKGIADIDAKVSAAMEAIERVVAGSPLTPVVTLTRAELRASGFAHLCLNELLSPGACELADNEMINWVEADDLLQNRPCFLPHQAVSLDRTLEAPRFWQSSDGLASGNTRLEAALHGLLERVERDAYTLWQLSPLKLRCRVDPAILRDEIVDGLVEKISTAGFVIRLFDMTTDLGISCFTALLAPMDFRERRELKMAEVNMGSGAHPNAVRAAIRAITEAAQSRMTFLSGARDDILDVVFTQACPQDTRASLDIEIGSGMREPQLVLGDVETLLQWVLTQLRTAGISQVAVADLSCNHLPVHVVKVVVPELENPYGHRKQRFGPRALLQAMAGA